MFTQTSGSTEVSVAQGERKPEATSSPYRWGFRIKVRLPNVP